MLYANCLDDFVILGGKSGKRQCSCPDITARRRVRTLFFPAHLVYGSSINQNAARACEPLSGVRPCYASAAGTLLRALYRGLVRGQPTMPPTITPQDVVHEWRQATFKERSAAKEHFIDLCRLLDHPAAATTTSGGTAGS